MYWASSETPRKYFCGKDDLCSVAFPIEWRRIALCIFCTAQHSSSAINEEGQHPFPDSRYMQQKACCSFGDEAVTGLHGGYFGESSQYCKQKQAWILRDPGINFSFYTHPIKFTFECCGTCKKWNKMILI